MAARQSSVHEMSREDKEAIRKNGVYLLSNVEPSPLFLKHLYQDGTLTSQMVEQIKAKNTTQDQVDQLISVLPRRGPRAFTSFIDALKNTNQSHVAKRLCPNISIETPPTPISVVSMPSPVQESCPDILDGNNLMEKPVLGINIKSINPEDPAIKKLLTDFKDVYKMTSSPRGRVIVINNTHNREGNEYDLVNISTLFTNLDFEVVILQDKTPDELESSLDKEAKDKSLRSMDCFVVFVMAHGSRDTVAVKNGTMHIDKEIINPFKNKNCEILHGKPKIFFIQACQNDPTKPQQFDLENEPEPQADASPIEAGLAAMSLHDERTRHTMEDIIKSSATIPGDKAYRTTGKGTWFVRSIVEIFSQHAHEEDLRSLLGKVKRRVLEYAQRYNYDGAQLPQDVDNTTKKIYFFPGYKAT